VVSAGWRAPHHQSDRHLALHRLSESVDQNQREGTVGMA
jgi:hypothetical protein